MVKVTKEHYGRLREDLPKRRGVCRCPIWEHSQAHLILANSDPAGPKNWLSPRAGGVFRFHDSAGSVITGEDTKKRISSWIWECNVAFDSLGEDGSAELPELTSDVIEELANRQQLTSDQRFARALQAIGKPPASLLVPQEYGPPTGDDRLLLFCAATECGSDPAELTWLLDELERAGLLRNQHPPGKTPNYVLTQSGLNRLETGMD